MASEQIKALLKEAAISVQKPEEVEIVESDVEPTNPKTVQVSDSPEQAASKILSAPEPVALTNQPNEPSGTSHVLKTRKQLIEKISEVIRSR